jgi:GNAT superfamily N-acetyltransferase
MHLFANAPTLYCLVVEIDAQLIGYATYMKQFSTWDSKFYVYMDCLFLNDLCRGLGIGEQLMHRIKIESVKLDCELIQWQTPDFNEGAIRFYNRIGASSKTKERFFLSSDE